MATLLRRLAPWFIELPPDLPRDLARFYVGAKIGYVAGVVIHGALVPVFLSIGQDVLGYYNIGSSLFFAVALALHLSRRPALAFVVPTVEIPVAAVLCTVYAGIEPLFFIYPLIATVYVPVATFLSLRLRCVVVAVEVSVFCGLAVYGLHVAPIQSMPLAWETAFALLNTGMAAFFVLCVIITFQSAVDRAEAALEAEYEKSEALLHNIMPPAVAARLKDNPDVIADSHKPVSILFADIVGFTEMSGRSSPEALVKLLNSVFSRFDALVDAAGLEKIKTIGDAYMVVAGLPEARDDHAHAIARLALDMVAATEAVSRETGERLQIRVGINTGAVVAGVIGQRKFAYDLWGDTVNVAARMESTGVAGRIQLSPEAAELLGEDFEIEPRGEVDVKGKGMMPVYFLNGEKAAQAAAV